jgi:hypothetical protein
MGQGSYGRRRQGRRRAAGAAAATYPRPRRELEHVMDGGRGLSGRGLSGRGLSGRGRSGRERAATNPRPRRELEHVMEVHAMEPRRRGRARRAERAADLFRRARDAHECVHLQCCAHALITCLVLRWDGPPKCARARVVLIELKRLWAAVVQATKPPVWYRHWCSL